MPTVPQSLPFDPTLPTYPTIIHALADNMARIPDNVALWCGDQELTYAKYGRAVAGYARRLADYGVAGGRVVLLMSNSIEMAVAAMAVKAARAQVAPMNSAYPPAALEPLVKDVAPTVIVCEAATADLGREMAEKSGVVHLDIFGPDDLNVELWSEDASQVFPDDMPIPEDRSTIFFTGGTTGLPKGADHTHANDIAYARATCSVWKYERDQDRLLNVAPYFHVWGYCHILIAPVFLGAAVDIIPAFKPDVVLQRFEQKQTTVFVGGPAALFIGLRAHPNFKTADLSSIRFSCAGGSPCPEDLLRGWENDIGSPILEGWGMSEGAPINLTPAGGQKVGAVGPNCPGTDVEVVDLETGNTVMPTGERGEVRLKGPQFIEGYRNRPEENAQTFREGWLYTGDIGYFDEDGYLYLVDRKKEMILVGGYNVYPREVDEVLMSHPAILEAAAVSAPDEFRGETVKACIALNEGESASEEEIINWCAERLVKYKVPTSVEIHDALPKTGPGKIDKLKLRGLR